LDLSFLENKDPSVLACWTLGTETGHAIADVLFGDYNPTGRLPMSFPRSVGQVPIYYSYKQTGRLYGGDYKEPASDRIYQSKYRDVKNSPLFPFGFGLSYTTFTYSNVVLDKTELTNTESINASITLTNTGTRDGEETVQLYIRDLVGSVTRPVKELKAFQKVQLKAGESRQVLFKITPSDLAFYRKDMSWGTEAGQFKVFIGSNAETINEARFTLK
jgi:beta-glucosidase